MVEVAAGGKPRVCLLTGAAGQLGQAFIERYGATCRIAAVYRDTPLRQPSQDMRFVDPLDPERPLPENRHAVFAIRADLTKDADIARVVELTLARFGAVDLLINAAADTRFHGSLLDIEVKEEAFMWQLQANVVAPLKLVARIADEFWKHRMDENLRLGRNIVNVSSISGLRIFPYAGQGFYSASKAAMNYLTSHLSAELRPYNVRANALAPARFPGQIEPVQVAEAIARLDGGALNGKIVVLDESGEKVSS